MVEKTFEEYKESGGFPEVIGLPKLLRIKVHQEYFNSILFRDLIERYDISHPRAVIDLAKKLLDNIASCYTLNSLTGFLKSLGNNVPKNVVSEYLKWFEDAYFLFTVRKFDASFHRSNSNPKKIYCVDHSLVKSVSSGILVNSGHILENMVFMALRRISEEVFYYRTSGNYEVDFIVKNQAGTLMLLQVCETLREPITRQREIRALQAAMTELDLSKGMIITNDEEESYSVSNGLIKVVPAWRFMLEISSMAKLTGFNLSGQDIS